MAMAMAKAMAMAMEIYIRNIPMKIKKKQLLQKMTLRKNSF